VLLEMSPSPFRSSSHFPNLTTGVANNHNGVSIAYDDHRSSNRTILRTVTVRSWLGSPDNDDYFNDYQTNLTEVISETICTLTQTYVEARVCCPSQNNCTIARIRESKTADRAHSPVTLLDGVIRL
jgi:hypothetical protein